eukprot:755727-Hanusia_phi.AAC.2
MRSAAGKSDQDGEGVTLVMVHITMSIQSEGAIFSNLSNEADEQGGQDMEAARKGTCGGNGSEQRTREGRTRKGAGGTDGRSYVDSSLVQSIIKSPLSITNGLPYRRAPISALRT